MSIKGTNDLIVGIISDQLEVEANTVTPESTAESLGMDSLDTVEMVVAIEEDFDLEIPDEDCEAWTTVQSIVNYVESRI